MLYFTLIFEYFKHEIGCHNAGTIFSSWEEFGWVGFQNSPLRSQTLNVPTEEDLNNDIRKVQKIGTKLFLVDTYNIPIAVSGTRESSNILG